MAEHTVDGDGNWVYDVRTAQELKEALETEPQDEECEYHDIIVNILNNINYNQSPYYKWMNIFINTPHYSNNTYNITINGNNHTLSNIYVYPGFSYLRVGGSKNGNKYIRINDLTFEVITNGGKVLDYQQYGRPTFLNNCIFNVRAYDVPNFGIFNFDGLGKGESTNCVFNVYITTVADNWYSLFTTITTFEACIFKIRNATSKVFSFFYATSSGSNITMDNCAFFYNDVGETQPDYANNINHIIMYGLQAGYGRIINTYFASFDYYPTMAVRPLIWLNSNDPLSTCTSTFYDNDKLQCLLSSGGLQPSLPPYFNACTTAQCKDAAYLSSIGYVFCEEA